jgi:hypothetical protein
MIFRIPGHLDIDFCVHAILASAVAGALSILGFGAWALLSRFAGAIPLNILAARAHVVIVMVVVVSTLAWAAAIYSFSTWALVSVGRMSRKARAFSVSCLATGALVDAVSRFAGASSMNGLARTGCGLAWRFATASVVMNCHFEFRIGATPCAIVFSGTACFDLEIGAGLACADTGNAHESAKHHDNQRHRTEQLSLSIHLCAFGLDSDLIW